MDIIDRFDTWLLDGEDRVRSSHAPSDATSCRRQLCYKWQMVEKSDPPTAGNIIKMEFGNLAEVLIHRWLKDEQEFGTITDLETQDEIWGEDERLISRIHGYQDFTWWTTDNHKVGLEIKSSFGRGIADIQHNHRPKPEHLVQVYFYLLWGDCDWFYLLYIGRDNGYRTSFRIDMAAEEKGLLVDGEFVPIDYEDIISRFIMIEFAVDNNNILPRDYTAAIKDGEIRDKYQRNNVEYKTDWQCNYCDWRRKCWADKLASGKMWHGDMEVA